MEKWRNGVSKVLSKNKLKLNLDGTLQNPQNYNFNSFNSKKSLGSLQLDLKSKKLPTDLIKQLDPNVVDIKKSNEAYALFKDLPEAIAEGSPLVKALKNGLINNAQTHGTARGAMFELEVALKLHENGESVKRLGQVFREFIPKRKSIRKVEIDIVTPLKLVECKNVCWHKIKNFNFGKLRSQIAMGNDLAQVLNKKYEFHSKFTIPNELKKWLIKNNITFTEGHL